MEIPAEVLAWATDETRAWFAEQRERHRPAGGVLPAVTKDAVRLFFPAAVLDNARVTVVPAIENPPFLEQARALGLPVEGIDFSGMYGLTAVDTILISEAFPSPDPLRLMFHELVHAVQYHILGLEEFSRQYVHGIAEGEFDYDRIPLEVMASDLEGRFGDNPAAVFSVQEEVRRSLRPR
jgi:hypothetical protein